MTREEFKSFVKNLHNAYETNRKRFDQERAGAESVRPFDPQLADLMQSHMDSAEAVYTYLLTRVEHNFEDKD